MNSLADTYQMIAEKVKGLDVGESVPVFVYGQWYYFKNDKELGFIGYAINREVAGFANFKPMTRCIFESKRQTLKAKEKK